MVGKLLVAGGNHLLSDGLCRFDGVRAIHEHLRLYNGHKAIRLQGGEEGRSYIVSRWKWLGR